MRAVKQPEFYWESWAFFLWQYSRPEVSGWVCETTQGTTGVYYYWDYRRKGWQKLDRLGSAFPFHFPERPDRLPQSMVCATREEAEAIMEEHRTLIAVTALGSL